MDTPKAVGNTPSLNDSVKVSELHGDAFVTSPDGKERKLHVGDEIKTGDTVRTSGAADMLLAVLVAGKLSTIQAPENAQLSVDKMVTPEGTNQIVVHDLNNTPLQVAGDTGANGSLVILNADGTEATGENHLYGLFGGLGLVGASTGFLPAAGALGAAALLASDSGSTSPGNGVNNGTTTGGASTGGLVTTLAQTATNLQHVVAPIPVVSDVVKGLTDPLIGNGDHSLLGGLLSGLGNALSNAGSNVPLIGGVLLTLGDALSGATAQTGIGGTLASLGSGLSQTTANTPLSPVGDLLQALLGDGHGNGLGGVVQNIGSGLETAAQGTPLQAVGDLLGGLLGHSPQADGVGNALGGANITSAGLSGGLHALSSAIASTPLAPLAVVTDTLGTGLQQVGGILSGIPDPLGLSHTLADVVGNTGVPSTSGAVGVAGLVTDVAHGLQVGLAQTPLSPLTTPVANALATSTGGVETGVAHGLEALGAVLANDHSLLSPLTSGVLGQVVGYNPAYTPAVGGVPGLLSGVSEALHAVVSPDSALAPLGAIVNPLASVLDAVGQGIHQVGNGISTAVAANDPSGLGHLIGGLLGGPLGSAVSSAQADASPLSLATTSSAISSAAQTSGLSVFDPLHLLNHQST